MIIDSAQIIAVILSPIFFTAKDIGMNNSGVKGRNLLQLAPP